MSEARPADAPVPSRRLAVRFSLSFVAVAFVSLMNQSLSAAVEEYSATADLPGWPIAGYIGFGILSGAAFGLAAMLPRRIPAFHWRRALTLVVLPAVIVALNVMAFTSPGLLPDWLLELGFLFGLQAATVGAVLVGVAISTAFAET